MNAIWDDLNFPRPLVTPDGLRSNYVLFELGARWGMGKALIPVVARGTRASSLPGTLKAINALDMAESGRINQFVENLAELLEMKIDKASSYQNKVKDLKELSEHVAIPDDASTTSAKIVDPAVNASESEILHILYKNDFVDEGSLLRKRRVSKGDLRYQCESLINKNLVTRRESRRSPMGLRSSGRANGSQPRPTGPEFRITQLGRTAYNEWESPS